MTDDSNEAGQSGIPAIVAGFRRFTHRLFHVRAPQTPPPLHKRTARTELFHLSGEERAGVRPDWHRPKETPTRKSYAGTSAGGVNKSTAKETVGRPKPHTDDEDDGGSRAFGNERTRSTKRPSERAWRNFGQSRSNEAQHEEESNHQRQQRQRARQQAEALQRQQEAMRAAEAGRSRKPSVAEQIIAEGQAYAAAERERYESLVQYEMERARLHRERRERTNDTTKPFSLNTKELDSVDSWFVDQLAKAPANGLRDQELQAERNIRRADQQREKQRKQDYSRGRTYDRGDDFGMSL